MTLEEIRDRVSAWVVRCFGKESLASRKERLLRLTEETVELAQAEGLSTRDVILVVARVYGRPVGEPRQEFSGVVMAALAYAKSTGFDPLETAEQELLRVESIPVEFFKQKHAVKLLDSTSIVPAPPAESRSC